MSLGGGIFLTQNKVLPGSYINFTSAARADAALRDRGTAAMAVELDWGNDSEIFCVESDEFLTDSSEIFGYGYADENIRGIRDLFKNASKSYFYRLNGGEKAKCDLGEARYSGTRGNDIIIAVTAEKEGFTVETYFDGVNIDSQKVMKMQEVEDNAYVIFDKESTLSATAGMNLSGGTNGEANAQAHQRFLDKAESLSFNTLGCNSNDEDIKELYIDYTKQKREKQGIKFQTVVYKKAAEYEGIINVENSVTDGDENSLIWWITGASAGCEISESLTNKIYDGVFSINTDYKQSELEEGIESGKFMLHKVGEKVRVLEDINTFTEFYADKNKDFSYNQVVRLIDQIGNDIAVLFNTSYLGKVQNNNAGRIALWSDIVTYNRELERLGVIENFKAEDVKVEIGSDKKTVSVENPIEAVCAMSKLYMTVIVG